MSKIVKVIPNDDYTLEIRLKNNHIIIYDMKPRLKTVRFCGLTDINKFKALRLENANTIVWDRLCQMTIDEIISMVEK
ncbi:DUF2442 domain-containing protein [Maledivibacter halophilus]|uniref:DUF2442 domain-containing protein n=1 Tax=Maledivibacter halophilus TaxID=36842 RepID=A0A1T5M8C0_9FIRM|nr:DUF2442 domain-containing protein [Maledivibacter halophilus]SKC84385.1 Protein of unknown function [Maledivibacter halophilus]